jgi:phosphoglycerol transferase
MTGANKKPFLSVRDIKRVAGLACLELVQVLVIATIALRLWMIDFRVPFNYCGDTLWFVVPIKGMIENGWTYDIPQLSAPFALSAAAFPAMTHFDWSIMKVISLFSSDPGMVLNVFWLVSVVLSAWSATLALHLLGVKNWMALGMGVVYAFLPFMFLRNVGHIVLVYYCVPMLILLAIYIARNCEHPRSSIVRLLGYSAAVAQGLNYIYFSFFAVLLVTFAGWLGFVQKRSWEPVKVAAIAVGIIVLAASLNLAPSFFSWHTHGKPPDMSYKSPQEAEIYGLKIRKMLSPHEANRLPIFSQWGQRDKSINFPNENENVTARLGPMAAAGLLFLLMVSLGLVRHQHVHESDLIKPIASLALFSLLLTTVGGFGAIFNQIFPDFRGYNRFSVFIAFLALAGIGLWWQMRIRTTVTQYTQKILVVGFIVLIAFSLYDQLLDSGHLNNRRPADEMSAKHEREFVEQIEAKVPLGTSVFQLPLTGFPADGGNVRMLPYEHARPYIWSSHLRWSWPSFSQQHRNWLDQLDGLEGADLVNALVLSKFRLIWVDRFGYPDNGESMISSLIAVGAADMLPGKSPRYTVLDMTEVAERLQRQLGNEEFARRQTALLEVPILTWGKGLYPLEYNPEGRKFRWSQAESTTEIHNRCSAPWTGVLSFYVAAGKIGKFTVSTGNQSISISATNEPTRVELPLTLKPSGSVEVYFVGEMGKINLPSGETRDLHFYLMDIQLQAVPVSKF